MFQWYFILFVFQANIVIPPEIFVSLLIILSGEKYIKDEYWEKEKMIHTGWLGRVHFRKVPNNINNALEFP